MDFGDGQTSSDKDPVHEYYNPGIYSVTLTVEDITGNSVEKKIKLL
jgi:PKD repeat protein